MMVVHEMGHVLACYATGGQVARVVLHPLAISRTDLSENPHPLVVCWAGPIIGILVPLLVHAIVKWQTSTYKSLSRFFAGFCLVANGAYLGFGSLSAIGDAGDLLRLETPQWMLWGFGFATSVAGLWLWNGLGPSFGFGPGKGKVGKRIVYTSLGLLVTIVLLELAISVL